MISGFPVADTPSLLQKWERRLAHLFGIYCKKKRELVGGRERARKRNEEDVYVCGGVGEKEREGMGETERARALAERESNLGHCLPIPVP